MNFITGRHLSRRTFLRGSGASVALPFLDAMSPAGRPWRDPAEGYTRFVALHEAMGCAGGNDWGDQQHLFAPAKVGRGLEIDQQNMLKPLEAYKEYMTVISQTDCRMAEPFKAEEIGGDHDRSTAVFLTQAHPLQTQADVYIGKSIDQIHADRFGQDTALPSLELTMERQDRTCAYNYHCAYTYSWRGRRRRDPLPAVLEPRIAFEQLFGAGDTPSDRAERLQTNKSLLDWSHGGDRGSEAAARCAGSSGTGRVHDERAGVGASDSVGRGSELEWRGASDAGGSDGRAEPVGRPHADDVRSAGTGAAGGFDASDLVHGGDRPGEPDAPGERDEQVASRCVAPRQRSGVDSGLQPDQHVPRFAVDVLPREVEEHDGGRVVTAGQVGDHLGLVDGRSEPAQPPSVPCWWYSGTGNGGLEGDVHVRAPQGTPMANALVSVMQSIGHDDFSHFGDSTGELPLTAPRGAVAASEAGV